MPPIPDLFLDSSALVAGVLSGHGAARALLQLCEAGAIRLTVSQQVIAETERALARKAPRALPTYRETLRVSSLRIVGDPRPADVRANAALISDPTDVPIVLAAMQVGTDFLVTLNRRDFLDDPGVAVRSGLRIGSPGDALAFVRARFNNDSG